nr:MAG TPA: hypothetical protein [Caudoviricetes sp.]
MALSIIEKEHGGCNYHLITNKGRRNNQWTKKEQS